MINNSMRRLKKVCLTVLLLNAVMPLNAQSIILNNNILHVSWKNPGIFTATHIPSGAVFLKEARLAGTDGVAELITVNDPQFGAGQAVKIKYPDGTVNHLTLFHQIPFLFIRSDKTNEEDNAIVLNEIHPLSAEVDLGIPSGQIKAFGTGGLKDPDRNPGSYTFLAAVDPSSRKGVVAAWLTHERGSGLVFTNVVDELVRIEPRLDYGSLRILPGKSAELETFVIGYFDDARLGLEEYADLVVKKYDIKLRPQPTGYCTWYADKHGRGGDEKYLPEIIDYAAKNLKPFGFNFIQIDDYWQEGIKDNGPAKNFTTHSPEGPYPSGMKAIADKIKASGITPGLWFMPFAGNHNDPLFKDHQDWFVKTPDGKPFENRWSGTVLDMTYPGAREHLKNVVSRISHEWGFRYFKMDGFYTGLAGKHLYTNDSYKKDSLNDAVYFNPDKTNVEAFRDGAKLVREAAGNDVFFLGCTMAMNMRVMGPSFGLVDAMRVGPDNGAAWRSLPRGPRFGSRFYFLHNRVWYNDPDPEYVRNSMPLNHARYITSWIGITGQLNVNSDWLPDIGPERLELLKRTMPSHNLKPRPSDLFEQEIPRIWTLNDNAGNRNIIGLFNHDSVDVVITDQLTRIGLADGKYEAFDFWANQLLDPVEQSIRFVTTAQDARIISLCPASTNPRLISTSRHITQGIIDVVEENWNGKKKILEGISRVVENDPYELRIVARNNTAMKIDISTEDQAAGVTANFQQEGPLVRVLIQSPVSREVKWKVKFNKANQRK